MPPPLPATPPPPIPETPTPRVAAAYPLGKRVKIAAASAGAAMLMRVLGGMMRIEAPPDSDAPAIRGDGRPILTALWHGDHLPILYAYRHRDIHVVTSQSADGQILTNVLHHLGYHCVRGSSTRGGRKAMVEMARAVRKGHDAAIAVDGPKGPRRVVKPGIILLAKLTGCPILPMGAAMARQWQVRSWDRYCIPKPFSRALIQVGQPLRVPRDADDAAMEQARLQLQERLMAVQLATEAAVAGR